MHARFCAPQLAPAWRKTGLRSLDLGTNTRRAARSSPSVLTAITLALLAHTCPRLSTLSLTNQVGRHWERQMQTVNGVNGPILRSWLRWRFSHGGGLWVTIHSDSGTQTSSRIRMLSACLPSRLQEWVTDEALEALLTSSHPPAPLTCTRSPSMRHNQGHAFSFQCPISEQSIVAPPHPLMGTKMTLGLTPNSSRICLH